MNEFRTYHPIVNLVYFLFVIGFSCVLMHPACLAVSLVCGFSYSVLLKGKKAVRANLVYMLPMLILAAVANPAFQHEGVTILAYLPSGNPLTLESIAYGLGAGVMLVSVLCWFSCYHQIMTSDKLIYLFGRIIPSLSLILSMTLRFVPKFAAQLKTVANAQRCIGRDGSRGSVVQRAKQGLTLLSIMTTWALENAVETADSMKSRGYGLPGRTAFSIFTFDRRDKKAFLCIVLLGAYTLAGHAMGGMYFRYFPSMKGREPSVFGLSVLAAYAALCSCPIIIELWEERKWKAIKSKL
ncbi:MAG: energy-coupling factor transporter transmembrane component T [Clostridia bacterium]|nr:energy-coupling factor transporter transmembrane component T [Clostridia bacterium]